MRGTLGAGPRTCRRSHLGTARRALLRRAARSRAGSLPGVSIQALETFYLCLLVLSSVVIMWFSFYVVLRLFKGQR
ncbi:hypothetical protein SAMN06264364_12036 [Quadrisphaera granulorum]|uniref:Uncharacterized protein n=1 Tax=Quadrisphaera granulorum TaxID=317664 RepID=A0A316A3A1_9ACTN|nr:hypothetical protein BXY45_12036 [Quadrisphaera granulorum]SZE97705.1 hypothetical protein SAMN06264364_12036 [Quadrisphaera granulorum]